MLNGPTQDEVLEWLENQKEQKPAEWSDEDDMLMNELESYILYDKEFNDEQKSWRIKRLKSLRPSWKPSEEQIRAFKNSVEHIPKAYYDDMREHYEQLKENKK